MFFVCHHRSGLSDQIQKKKTLAETRILCRSEEKKARLALCLQSDDSLRFCMFGQGEKQGRLVCRLWHHKGFISRAVCFIAREGQDGHGKIPVRDAVRKQSWSTISVILGLYSKNGHKCHHNNDNHQITWHHGLVPFLSAQSDLQVTSWPPTPWPGSALQLTRPWLSAACLPAYSHSFSFFFLVFFFLFWKAFRRKKNFHHRRPPTYLLRHCGTRGPAPPYEDDGVIDLNDGAKCGRPISQLLSSAVSGPVKDWTRSLLRRGGLEVRSNSQAWPPSDGAAAAAAVSWRLHVMPCSVHACKSRRTKEGGRKKLLWLLQFFYALKKSGRICLPPES